MGAGIGISSTRTSRLCTVFLCGSSDTGSRAGERYRTKGVEVTQAQAVSNSWKTILGILCFSAVACAGSSAQQASARRAATASTIALVSDTCPIVRGGDAVSLDWNPGFDPSWAVAGVRWVRLRFGSLQEDGVTVRERPGVVIGGRMSPQTISAPVNGYFHLELTIDRRIPPGVYHLVEATAMAQTVPAYQGASPRVTVSPVSQRYCITVVKLFTQQAASGN